MSHMVNHSGNMDVSVVYTEWGEKFKNQVEANSHMNEHLFKCSRCTQAFPNAFSLLQHLQTHSKDHLFKCDKCTQVFSNAGSLDQHLQTHGKDHLFKCSKCTQAFPDAFNLLQHLQTHSKVDLLKCSNCTQIFPDAFSLLKHQQAQNKIHLFKCSKCTRAFPSACSLNRHLQTHTTVHLFKCSKCTQVFPNAYSLDQHQHRAHMQSEEKAFFCDICGERFDANSVMVQHRKGHVQIQNSSLTGVQSNLMDHVKIHTSGGTCPAPGSIVFVVKSAAKSEPPEPTQLNQGKDPIESYMCNKTFSMKTDLVDHMEETHSSMKEQYSCGVCGKVFSHHVNRRHVLRHVNNHLRKKCMKCDESFAFMHQLRSHELLHKPKSECCRTRASKRAIVTGGDQKVNPYTCTVCEGTFTNKHVTVLNLQTMLCLPPKRKRRKQEFVTADNAEEENEQQVKLNALEDMKDKMVFCNTCLVSGNVCCALCEEQKNVCDFRSHIGLHTGEILLCEN